jgi:NIPSNAP
MAFYELREYSVRSGKMKEWLDLMENHILPFQISKGMVVTGSYQGENDDSVYIWTRRFESEEQREKLYAAVYESEFWKTVVAPQLGNLIDPACKKVTRLSPTKASPAQ